MGRGKAKASLALVEAAKAILAEIQPATVRAVCYRLFVANVIDSMAKNNTNKVSRQLTWAREQELIPWSWIVDETRVVERVNAWENPSAFVDSVTRAYRKDRWTCQPHWLEVWSEKGTVRGTLAPVLDQYGLTFRVMHGYGSATAVYQAARDTQQAGRKLTILYVGDWDPSGLHMSQEDLPQRLREYGGRVRFIRLALTREDIASPDLPSFDVDSKKGDPRYRWYRDRFGARCWELDALSPVLLRQRVEDAVRDRLDHDAWHRADIAEAAERESLTEILSIWPSHAHIEAIARQASKYEGEA